MSIAKVSLIAAVVLPMSALGVLTASPASASCTNAADVTFCSAGGVGAEAVAPLPIVPYPCDYDWFCVDGGLSLMFDPTMEVGQHDSGGLNAARDRPGGSYLDE
jgi:hypothetical protein